MGHLSLTHTHTHISVAVTQLSVTQLWKSRLRLDLKPWKSSSWSQAGQLGAQVALKWQLLWYMMPTLTYGTTKICHAIQKANTREGNCKTKRHCSKNGTPQEWSSGEQDIEIEGGCTCYEAPVLLPDDLEFGVQSLGSIQNFTKVKRDGVFLDIGFSSCAAPTFCRSLGISDIGSGSGARFGV